jgi:hypothetical protein
VSGRGFTMGRRRKLVIGILLGVASVLVVLSACDRMLGKTIDLPPVISGRIRGDRTVALTSSQVATIANWLAQHRSGWSSELATLGSSGAAYISLDTAARESAVRLTLRPGPDGAMSIEYRADRDVAINSFSGDELAAIREIVGIVLRPWPSTR